MFIGEFLCVLPLIWNWLNTPTKGRPSYLSRLLARGGDNAYSPVDSEEPDAADAASAASSETEVAQVTMQGWAMCWMWFPAFFDSESHVTGPCIWELIILSVCGTTLMNVGLILTPVSIYQMSRGALVLWVGVLSVIFLRRHLYLYQWSALVIVTLGVALVGLAGTLDKRASFPNGDDLVATVLDIATSTRADDDPAKVALGVILILIAQIFTASQYVVEEKIMSHYSVEPLMAVTLEGMFGGLTTLAAMPVLHIFFAKKSPYFDMPRGWHQIINTPAIMWASFAIALSIGAFNFFGLSVTSRVSATTRSTIDTCRTLGIWIVSLMIGWEHLGPFSLLQITGFGMLVYGTFVYNGLVEPILFKPARIQLPEDEVAPHA